jgi:hypothetical protein
VGSAQPNAVVRGPRGIRNAPWERRVAIATAVVAMGFLAACGNSSNPFPTPTPTSTAAASGSPSASPSPLDLKPVLSGLLDRNGVPPPSFVGALAGYVVNVHWSQLQPTSGGSLAANNPIDQAIAEVRSLNATDHTHLGLKIRLFAGIWAPDWVKSLDGSPVTVTNPQNGQSSTIGRFWTDAFGQAYDQLEILLAAKYDTVPEVREVTISRCTTFYDEPFIRDTQDPATVSSLLGAGYTMAADQTCQQQEIRASTVWQHTHSDLSFNPYQEIVSVGASRTDEAFTESMMQFCRTVLGTACVLENNSLRDPPPGAAYALMYESMMQLGAPIAFQTASSSRVGSLAQVLAYAVTLRADSVELPANYSSVGTPASFASEALLLAGNAVT